MSNIQFYLSTGNKTKTMYACVGVCICWEKGETDTEEHETTTTEEKPNIKSLFLHEGRYREILFSVGRKELLFTAFVFCFMDMFFPCALNRFLFAIHKNV